MLGNIAVCFDRNRGVRHHYTYMIVIVGYVSICGSTNRCDGVMCCPNVLIVLVLDLWYFRICEG